MSFPKRFKNRAEYLRWLYWRNVEYSRKNWSRIQRNWRKRNPEKARKADRIKHKRDKEKRYAYYKEYQKTHKPDPFKNKARAEVNKAIRLGKVKRPKKCSACLKQKKVDAHHPDYSKPLKVKWLCRRCHALEHHPIIYNKPLEPKKP